MLLAVEFLKWSFLIIGYLTENSLVVCYGCEDTVLPTEHGLSIIENVQTDIKTDEHALSTTPPGFSVRKSGLPGAGLGAFAEVTIPKGTRLGPYNGVLFSTKVKEMNMAYVWTVHYDHYTDRVKHYVDAGPTSHASWLRYVNAAITIDQENLYVYFYNNEVYYVTYECIQPGTELLVWYGESYGLDLELNRTENDYRRRFNETEARVVYLNTIGLGPQTIQVSTSCYGFIHQSPFTSPPGYTGSYVRMCRPVQLYDVCKYFKCDTNPCTKVADCGDCIGFCFHLGKYIKPYQEILNSDNINRCLCGPDLNRYCSNRYSAFRDMCRY